MTPASLPPSARPNAANRYGRIKADHRHADRIGRRLAASPGTALAA